MHTNHEEIAEPWAGTEACFDQRGVFVVVVRPGVLQPNHFWAAWALNVHFFNEFVAALNFHARVNQGFKLQAL